MQRLLFWQGRGKPADVMADFLARLSLSYEVVLFPLTYDSGDVPFSRDSYWFGWLSKQHFDWWCGISLGASLLYAMSSFKEIAPERISLINPFYSRMVLSQEKGFSLEHQWNFDLAQYQPAAKQLDLVLSLYDTKIPMHHGIELLNHTLVASQKSLEAANSIVNPLSSSVANSTTNSIEPVEKTGGNESTGIAVSVEKLESVRLTKTPKVQEIADFSAGGAGVAGVEKSQVLVESLESVLPAKTQVASKHLIFVDSDHCISDSDSQIELADLLSLGLEHNGSDGFLKHCHMYSA